MDHGRGRFYVSWKAFTRRIIQIYSGQGGERGIFYNSMVFFSLDFSYFENSNICIGIVWCIEVPFISFFSLPILTDCFQSSLYRGAQLRTISSPRNRMEGALLFLFFFLYFPMRSCLCFNLVPARRGACGLCSFLFFSFLSFFPFFFIYFFS